MRQRVRTIRSLSSIAAVNVGAKLLNVPAIIVLARLLSPHDFGLVAIAAIVTGLLSLFQDLGLSAALVQLKEDSATARNVCFWGNLISRSALYVIAFLTAGAVGAFFSEPEIALIIRVSALALLIQAIGSTHAAILHRELRFSDVAKVDAMNTLVGTTATLVFAYAGASYWSLVLGALISEPVGVALLWRLVLWRPSLEVRGDIAKRMLDFGKHVGLINTLYFGLRNLDDLVVGKLLGALALGYFGMSMRLGMFTAANVGVVVSHVMFPTYARMHSNIEKIRVAFRDTLRGMTTIVVPITLISVILAKPLVQVLLGDAWNPTVEPLRILAVYGLAYSLVAVAANIFLAKGRPDLSTLIGAVQLAILASVILPLISLAGITGAAIAASSALVVGAGLSLYLASKLLEVGWIFYADLFVPIALASLPGAILGSLIPILISEPISQLALGSILVCSTYAVCLQKLTKGELRRDLITVWHSLLEQRQSTDPLQ
jgi:O-antigen/teichoic acid export membrane protein